MLRAWVPSFCVLLGATRSGRNRTPKVWPGEAGCDACLRGYPPTTGGKSFGFNRIRWLPAAKILKRLGLWAKNRKQTTYPLCGPSAWCDGDFSTLYLSIEAGGYPLCQESLGVKTASLLGISRFG